MKLTEQLNKMKKMMGINEDIIRVDLTPEYFLQRVPFFKTFNNNSTPKAVGFQKVVYNANVEMYVPQAEEKYVFPIFNTHTLFTYSKYILNDKYQYVFQLQNELIATKPENMDSFTYTVINVANNMQAKKLSYNKELLIPDEKIPDDELNKIINDINGCLFQFEEFINNQTGLSLKNPLDEQVSPTEVTDNISAINSLLKKKRNVATVFFNLQQNPDDYKETISLINSNPELNTLVVDKNPYKLFIVYRNGFEHDAEELKNLYNQHGGIISNQAPHQVQRRVGELLGYHKAHIDNYINTQMSEIDSIGEEQIKAYRGIGNNIAYNGTPAENEGFLWVATNPTVANDYAEYNHDKKKFNTQELNIERPHNPLVLPYKSNVHLRATDISNNLRILRDQKFKKKEMNNDTFQMVSELIKNYEAAAGDNLEPYHTKIDKPGASKIIAKILTILGYDAVQINTEHGETYGIVKN